MRKYHGFLQRYLPPVNKCVLCFTGSVTPGKRADIIIVDGNPLTNIRDIRNVQTVIKDGDIYDPSKLHAIAGFQ